MIFSLSLQNDSTTYSASKIVMYVFNEARTDEFIHNSLDFYRQAYISDDKYKKKWNNIAI